MKIKIKERTGQDLFYYLDLYEENPERAKEWSVTEFVDFDDVPATLEDFIKLSGESQALITGRIFTLGVKGVFQDEDELFFKDQIIKRRPIPHDIIEKLQIRLQRLKEKGNSGISKTVRESIFMFYEIKQEELEKLDYAVSAFMFNYVNSFFSRVAESKNEFDIDD